ncbi:MULTISPECIES: UDP-N-acetylmuramoyl-L-alanyl-D-glutamate--2,6-diaminopimelate ligase [unclassified Chelatococcus]|uniref:UDP-N-acetylmuramoyl-L-alanyl-D-glutamate--2, 6-diaminopimelate ligase n=1 Tax=unclassified Chelatococcus TaxID=2638111 RepID=UPI001BCD0C03|nr:MULTISPECIES: UDP-N-acetylmuramoyl-L-alanyl-D-glutamate--2,6-diaminopimelate ligase [unclassified Chelatococcus]MBS7697908.1 UDP-N-acetylmuramoyl-L-alanyl-D-glutamate--2,6-diaminopimelate ligase [Chelatococcus sp. YT9]MBX3558515.1 UDP-N-acetylmuramoyl-L-alanyl-D-glutamate--2,6-diaminopimelate ligase [Chelatococcus sp.]
MNTPVPEAARFLGDLIPGQFAESEARRAIAGLTADSRAVQPGFLFVAVPGTKADGLAFAGDAVRRGAVAIVGEGPRPAGIPADIAFAQVANVRRVLALAAARFYPRQPETIVAVTGTSGKSSVAEFTRQIFASLGHQAASLGTIGVVAPGGAVYGSLTTPDPVALHRTLDQLARDGVTHLAMEASSHGLDQHRLDGVRLTAGGFTNLGRDHLDYHPTVEAYLQAKLRLFTDLLPDGATVVVNADAPESRAVADVARARGLRLLSVGEAGVDLKLARIEQQGFDQMLSVSHGSGIAKVRLPLAGDFQASNALVAAGLAIATREDPHQVLAALEGVSGVKGRMERVATAKGALVIVDYAHKPDALDHVLTALRPYATGKLVVVFGAGGDRDQGKRPIMGRIAAERADVVIVTDDNPRSEDPATIRAAILAAAPGAREIGDRAEAIRTAVAELTAGDVLVIAGKGHETGQIIGTKTLPFSDHDAVTEAIAALRLP